MGNRRAQSCAPARELWRAGKLPKKSGENLNNPGQSAWVFYGFLTKCQAQSQVKVKIKVKIKVKSSKVPGTEGKSKR